MYRRCLALFAALFAVSLLPSLALANARLVSVTPKDGGCVAGPTGNNVEAWDIQRDKTYTLRVDHLLECAHGGTDACVQFVVQSSATGNTVINAHKISTGVYEFDFRMPRNGCDTYPIRYCLSDCRVAGGIVVGRHDTGNAQSHLRAASFGPGCTSPTPITDCHKTATLGTTWGSLKVYYR